MFLTLVGFFFLIFQQGLFDKPYSEQPDLMGDITLQHNQACRSMQNFS